MDFEKTGDAQVNAVVGTSADSDRPGIASAAGGGGMPSYMAFVILVSGVVGGLLLVVAVIMLCKHCSPKQKQHRGSQELMLQKSVAKPTTDETPNCSAGCAESESVHREDRRTYGVQPVACLRRPSSIVIPADAEVPKIAASGEDDRSRSCDTIARQTQDMNAADPPSRGLNSASSCSSVDAEIATLTKVPSATVTRQTTQRPPLPASAAGSIVHHQPLGSLAQSSQSTIHSSMDSADNRSEITVIDAYAPPITAPGAAGLTPPRLAASIRDDGCGGRSKSFAGHQQHERWLPKTRNYVSQDSAPFAASVAADYIATSGSMIASAAAAKADSGFPRFRSESGECRSHIVDQSPRGDSADFAIHFRQSPSSVGNRERQLGTARTDASMSNRPHILTLGPGGQRGLTSSGSTVDGKTSMTVALTNRSRSGEGDIEPRAVLGHGVGGNGTCRSFDGFQSRSFETQALVHRSPLAPDAQAELFRSPNASADRRPVLHCNGGGADAGGCRRRAEQGYRTSNDMPPSTASERVNGGVSAPMGGGGEAAICNQSPSTSGEVGNRALWVLRSAIEQEGYDRSSLDNAIEPGEKEEESVASADPGYLQASLASRGGGSSSASLSSKQLQAKMTSLPSGTEQRLEQDLSCGGGSGAGGSSEHAPERRGNNRGNKLHGEEQRIVAAMAEVPTSETGSSRRARFQSFLVNRARSRLLDVQSSTDRSLDDSFDTASMTEGGTASESSRKNTTSFDSSSTTGAESSTSELPIRRAAAAAAAATAAAVSTNTSADSDIAAADRRKVDAPNDDLRSRRKSGAVSLTSKKRRDFQKGRWRSSLDESDCSDTLEDARSRPAGSGGGGGFAVGGLLRIPRRGGSARVGAYDYQLPGRDYSIDEKTDAIFREFVRIDPAYESKQFPCSGGSATKRAQRFSKRYFSEGGSASAEAYYGSGMGCVNADGGCMVGAVGLVNLTEEDASEL